MRAIQAFTVTRTGYDAMSGILDWLLSPYYFKRACPNIPLVLYTNKKSVKELGDLWPFIAEYYDEVYTNLIVDVEGIFSAPKFEAMTRELETHGPDFVMIDNDIYAFDGFLSNMPDYGAYYPEDFLLDWYNSIIDGRYGKFSYPKWLTWKAIPYNCAVMRFNNREFLIEYLETFYQTKVEELRTAPLEKAIVKEQWTLGELFNKYNIKPVYFEPRHDSLHKGKLKITAKPSHVLNIQEYLLAWLRPKAFKAYKAMFGQFKFTTYDLEWCFNEFLANYEQEGLLKPIYELQAKRSNK